MNKFFFEASDIDKNKFQFSIGKEKGKFCFIDAMNRIYRQSINLIGRDSNTQNNYHIVSTFDFIINMLKYGILPVYVFDGKFPKEKKLVVDQRNSNKKMYEEICESIEDKTSDVYYRNKRKCYKLYREQLNECKKILELFGLKYVEAPEEADQQCVALGKYYKDDCVGVISEDWDTVVAPIVLKEFTFKNSNYITRKIKYEDLKEICLERANTIRKKNNLMTINKFTDDNFINFSLLSGSDYTVDDKLFKLDMELDELFEIFVLCDFCVVKMGEKLEKKDIMKKEEFINFMTKLKLIYRDAKVINPKELNLTPDKIKKEELIKFLCSNKNMQKDFVEKELNEIEISYYALKKICENLNNPRNFTSLKSYQYKHYSEKFYLEKNKSILKLSDNKNIQEKKENKKEYQSNKYNYEKYNYYNNINHNIHQNINKTNKTNIMFRALEAKA